MGHENECRNSTTSKNMKELVNGGFSNSFIIVVLIRSLLFL